MNESFRRTKSLFIVNMLSIFVLNKNLRSLKDDQCRTSILLVNISYLRLLIWDNLMKKSFEDHFTLNHYEDVSTMYI